MQERMLLEILEGLRSSEIDEVRVTHGHHGVGVTVSVPRRLTVRGEWEAVLLANAFRDRSAAEDQPPVEWVESADVGQALGPPRATSPVAPPRETAARRIEFAASSTGALLNRVELLQPLGIAPAVELAVADVHAFLRHGARAYLELSGRSDDSLDGSFVAVLDGGEHPAWLTGYAHHWGTGSARPDVACCDPRTSIGGIDAPPPRPPCAAELRSSEQLLASFRRTMEVRTGRGPEGWADLVRAQGDAVQRMRVLQGEHGLGQADALAVVTPD